MWGKRDDDEEKRAWGEKSSRLWGKRMSADQLARLLQEHGIVIPGDELQDKRKWAKNKANSTQDSGPVDVIPAAGLNKWVIFSHLGFVFRQFPLFRPRVTVSVLVLLHAITACVLLQ